MTETQSTTSLPTSPAKNPISTIEKIWKSLFFVISLVFAVLFKKMYIFRMDPENQSFLAGSFTNILLSIPLMVVFHFVKKSLIHNTHTRISDALCQKRIPNLDKRIERGKLLGRWLFDIFYYFFTFVIGIYIMKDHESFPDISGGGFECKNILSHVIPEALAFKMEVFYLVQFSNHLYSLVSHVLDQNLYGKTKYYEFALHHSFSVFLIFYSYMYNLWAIGIMVMIFHDYSDFILIIARFYMDLRIRNNTLMTLLCAYLIIIWIITRILMFPKCCIVTVFTHPILTPELTYMVSMEIGLVLMHLYWLYVMFASAANFNKRKGQY